MPQLKITVPGEVKGLARPRATSFHGHARLYDSSSNLNEKGRLQVFLRDALKNSGLDGRLACSPMGYTLGVEAYFKCPKSMSKRTRESALHDVIRPTKKPDLDNVLKMICDAWNGLLWEDDSQITSMSISKMYGEEERMEIFVIWTEANR